MQTFTISQIHNRFLSGKTSELDGLCSVAPLNFIVNSQIGFIGGGAVRKTIQNIPLDTDIDIYFKSQADFDLCLTYFNQHRIDEIVDNGLNKTFHILINNKKYKIQFVYMIYCPKIEDFIEHADFTICQFAYDGEKIYCGDFSMYDLANKKLNIYYITSPHFSLQRISKYNEQGFCSCDGKCLKTILSQIPLNEPIIVA